MLLNRKDGVNDIKREEINLIKNLGKEVVKDLDRKTPIMYSFMQRGNEDGWSIVPCFRKALNFGWIKASGMFLIRTQIAVPIEKIFGFIIGIFALHGTQSKGLDIAYIVGTLVLFIAFGLMEVFEHDFKIQNEFKEKLRKKYPLKTPNILLAKYILGPTRYFSKAKDQTIISEVLADLKKIQEKLENLIKSDIPKPRDRNRSNLHSNLFMLGNSQV